VIPDKKRTVTEVAAVGEVLLILDARQPGVLVPERLRDARELRLKFSYNYDTGGLTIDERGVRQCLQFGGEVAVCVVPWAALIAAVSMTTKLGCGWDAPPEPRPRPSHLRLLN
jgi:hypothetical protein